MSSTADAAINQSDASARRSFFARFAAMGVGAIAAVFPFAAGSGVLFDPLRRRRRAAGGEDQESIGFVRICPLDALPADGVPHGFAVTTAATDAWTRVPSQRVGRAFLVRDDAGGTPKVSAFTATCPHLGCAVEFSPAEDRFECPCHESGFGKDGRKLFGPSLRGLDPLEVKLVEKDDTQEVWVAFQHFRAGVAERIPAG